MRGPVNAKAVEGINGSHIAIDTTAGIGMGGMTLSVMKCGFLPDRGCTPTCEHPILR